MTENTPSALNYSLYSKSCRAHPLTILANLRHVLFLVLIPLIRGISSALARTGSYSAWLSRVWTDVLILALMLGLAVWLWLRVRLIVSLKALTLITGLFVRRTVSIPFDKAATVSFLTHFSLLPFKAVRFNTDVPGASGRKNRLSLLLWQKDADEIKRLLFCSPEKQEPMYVKESQKPGMTWCANCERLEATPSAEYRPTAGKIAALSLLTSNSFSGILYMSVFVSQSGKILGGEFSRALTGVFDRAAHFFEIFLPPLAAAFSALLLAGWAVGFMRLFLRYSGFRFVSRSGLLTACGGVFSRHERHIRRSEVLFADFRQSFTTKLLRLYSLYLCAGGVGEKKSDYSCVILTEKSARFESIRAALLPEYSPVVRQVKPDRRCFLRFIYTPAVLLASVPFVYKLLTRHLVGFDDFFAFASAMTAALALWFLAVNVADFFTSGAAFDGKLYTLRYSTGFSFHTAVILKENAALFEIKQGLFQRPGAYCDLIVRTKAARRQAHRCRSLKKTEVLRLLNIS